MEEFPAPVRILQLVLAGTILFLLVFGAFLLLFSHAIFDPPRVTIDNTTPPLPPIVVSHTFPFRNGSKTVTIPVNATVYSSSKKIYRSIILFGNGEEVGRRYYRAMINDPTQDAIYEDLLGQFRRIRAGENLSDDEYLEMMAAYVQTIPYRDGGNTPPKYPAELLVEKMGDCDDKAILLAGLLAREGYTVALFKFGPESHMAMGIGSDAFLYRSTGYTYLESMTPAYVGVPSSYVMTHRLLHSDPLVIPVSTGFRVYRSGNETRFITSRSALAEQEAGELSARLGSFSPGERDSTGYREILSERDRLSAVHEYLTNHPNDRPGSFAYAIREMPA